MLTNKQYTLRTEIKICARFVPQSCNLKQLISCRTQTNVITNTFYDMFELNTQYIYPIRNNTIFRDTLCNFNYDAFAKTN